MTDGTDRAVAKQNCESALAKFPDLAAVAGLWSYNTPQCIEALKSKGKLGKVKVFAFDEEEAVLEAIAQGNCEGTIVQQPFEFGYQSMKFLKAIADGKKLDIPADKVMPVPARTITKENLEEFRANLKKLRAEGEAAAAASPPAGAPKFAFVINNNSPFWSYARAGLKKAEAELGIIAEFQAPPNGTVEEQNRILESILLKGAEYKGVAISPVNAANQTAALNKVAAAMPLITQDSDAPRSNRLFYVGTNNIDAGAMLGKLMKDKMAGGGQLVLFVGSMDADNAKERRQGLIKELSK
jgi:ribose transport system substrate-binding protein